MVRHLRIDAGEMLIKSDSKITEKNYSTATYVVVLELLLLCSAAVIVHYQKRCTRM